MTTTKRQKRARDRLIKGTPGLPPRKKKPSKAVPGGPFDPTKKKDPVPGGPYKPSKGPKYMTPMTLKGGPTIKGEKRGKPVYTKQQQMLMKMGVRPGSKKFGEVKMQPAPKTMKKYALGGEAAESVGRATVERSQRKIRRKAVDDMLDRVYGTGIKPKKKPKNPNRIKPKKKPINPKTRKPKGIGFKGKRD
jgi:hypothetical protein